MIKFSHIAINLSRLAKVQSLASLTSLTHEEFGFQQVDKLPFGSLLVVAPHPDDESIGAAGLILAAAAQAIPVHLVWLTDGDKGGQAKTRQKEALAAARVLGLSPDHNHFLHAKEGHLEPISNELKELIARYQPSAISLPGFWENQPDHRAANQLLLKVLAEATEKPAIWAYEIWTPYLINRLLPINAHFTTKQAAISAYPSQLSQRPYVEMATALNRYRAASQGLTGHAEGYFVAPFDVYQRLYLKSQ